MIARDALLAEFDHEMAVTRRLLERMPPDGLTWRPHEKSWTLGGLATHLSRLPHWGTQILDQESYTLAETSVPAIEASTVDEVLQQFDRHVAEARQSLTGKSDAELLAPWSLRRGDVTILTMPKTTALERFLIHHVVHHRGQMTVYLRLQGVPLPPIYGPTADERL